MSSRPASATTARRHDDRHGAAAEFWSRRAGRPVTPEDVRAITENLSAFVSLLGEWAAKEASSTTGTADEAGGDE